MFPYVWGNPMIPAFENAKRTAANIPAPDEQGAYTSGMFQTDFPQFFSKSALPAVADSVNVPSLFKDGED